MLLGRLDDLGPADAPRQNGCGDQDPTCIGLTLGAPFPLQGDQPGDPNESDRGLERDPMGYLQLGTKSGAFNFLWIANSNDWQSGTVSKLDSRAVKEVARYLSVTCYSNPEGSRAACDGTVGCCSRDDQGRYLARLAKLPEPWHQPVQTRDNSPSRTAVDLNGDVWVANRAFSGQSSVTKIANDEADCVERNGAPGLQTSSDVNGDGLIDTDCNQNGKPDDLGDLPGSPCKNGQAQEFYGLDDECILFTTHHNLPNQWGRPLTLARNSIDSGPSDAWAGGYNNGRFFRISGTDGLLRAEAQVQKGAYGAAVDRSGIVWVARLGAGIDYFDSAAPAATGTARMPVQFVVSSYGISLDPDQNIWTGGWGSGHAYRYTPDRASFASLGQGYWTQVASPGESAGAAGNGRGIAADARLPNYFVWMTRDSGWVARIEGALLPKPAGSDLLLSGTGMPAVRVAGTSTIGVGVDTDQNIWGISHSGSVATRIRTDGAGTMTPPDLTSGVPGAGCPAGDRCGLRYVHPGGTANPEPNPYTYSDFTGFGLRNFTRPSGSFTYNFQGCSPSQQSRWMALSWKADVPLNTALTARVRSGPTPKPDNKWGPWTGPLKSSPAQLQGTLAPNPAPYLQVEFNFASLDRSATPKLKSFTVHRECFVTIQ